MSAKETDWAWLAGFMDGEGSFYPILEKRSANRSGHRIQPEMSVSNTNIPMLEEVVRICGGRLCNEHEKRRNHKAVYRVRWRRHEIISIIPKMLPYLVGKRKQAEMLLDLAIRTTGRFRRYTTEQWQEVMSLYNNIRSLNSRGTEGYQFVAVGLRKAAYGKDRRCSVEHCFGKHYGKTYCRKHYKELVDYPKRRRFKTMVIHDRGKEGVCLN